MRRDTDLDSKDDTDVKVAQVIGALSLALLGMAVVLQLRRPAGIAGVEDPDLEKIVDGLVLFPFALVGVLLIVKRGNPLGWVMCAAGFLGELGYFMSEYSLRALFVDPGSLPGGEIANLIGANTFVPVVVINFVFLTLLFPSGRPPSPRWTPVLWMAGTALGSFLVSSLLMPGPIDEDRPSLLNPIGITAARPLFEVVQAVAGIVVAVAFVAALVSLFVRLVRSEGEARRWIALFAGVFFARIAMFAVDDAVQEVIPAWGPLAPLVITSAIPVIVYRVAVRAPLLPSKQTHKDG